MPLFNLLNRHSTQAQHKTDHLLLIDFHPFSRGGHFGHYMSWFAEEFCKRYDSVTALSPDAKAFEAQFSTYQSVLPKNLRFSDLSRKERKYFDLDSLAQRHRRRNDFMQAFIMWGYDLLDFKHYRRPHIPWATMIGINWLHRGTRKDNRERELSLLKFLEEDPECQAFLQPDQFLNDRHARAIWLPDLQPVECQKQDSSLIQRIREHTQGALSIGAFGILTGYRCMDLLLQLAVAQPQIRFVAAGRLVEDSIRDDLRHLIKTGKLENLLLVPGFIESENLINSALCSVDALLIDSSQYPVQTGMVSKALYHGRWLLTTQADSWTNDMIQVHQAGHVLNGLNEDLHALHQAWLTAGRPAASQKIARELRKPENIASCFDTLCSRLKQTRM